MGKCPRGWDVCTNRKSISYPSGEQLVQMMDDQVDEVIRKGTEKLRTLTQVMRLPDDSINNCSLKHGDEEEGCQICGGHCPDKKRLVEEVVSKFTVGTGLDPGDLIEVTIGQETFTPGTGGSFTVGPITVKTVVRPRNHDIGSESSQQAYTRARTEASLMFETEYQLKRNEFFTRTKEVNEKCQEESQSLSR